MKNHIKVVKNENDRSNDENNEQRRKTLKSNRCKKCNALKIKIDNLYETLTKFTVEKNNIEKILSDQITFYNKV